MSVADCFWSSFALSILAGLSAARVGWRVFYQHSSRLSLRGLPLTRALARTARLEQSRLRPAFPLTLGGES